MRCLCEVWPWVPCAGDVRHSTDSRQLHGQPGVPVGLHRLYPGELQEPRHGLLCCWVQECTTKKLWPFFFSCQLAGWRKENRRVLIAVCAWHHPDGATRVTPAPGPFLMDRAVQPPAANPNGTTDADVQELTALLEAVPMSCPQRPFLDDVSRTPCTAAGLPFASCFCPDQT